MAVAERRPGATIPTGQTQAERSDTQRHDAQADRPAGGGLEITEPSRKAISTNQHHDSPQGRKDNSMSKISTYETREALLASMERIARRTVKHYFSDYTEYDAPAVAAMEAGTSWIWLVRECGTHLYRSYASDSIRAVLECWTPERVNVYHLVIGPTGCTLQKVDAARCLARCKADLATPKEYVISYHAGTSPYWYKAVVYAGCSSGAVEAFKHSDACPYNVRDIQVERARPV